MEGFLGVVNTEVAASKETKESGLVRSARGKLRRVETTAQLLCVLCPRGVSSPWMFCCHHWHQVHDFQTQVAGMVTVGSEKAKESRVCEEKA